MKRQSSLATMLFIVCMMIAKANAGVVILMEEPRSYQPGVLPADVEIWLEQDNRLSELESYVSIRTHESRRGSTYTCDGSGWFAAVLGRVPNARRKPSNMSRSAVGAACGASSKSDAERAALNACRGKAKSGVVCELDFVKYDPGNISFLSDWNHLGNGGFRQHGASANSGFGCCHAKYSGLDAAPTNSARTHPSPRKSSLNTAEMNLLVAKATDKCNPYSDGDLAYAADVIQNTYVLYNTTNGWPIPRSLEEALAWHEKLAAMFNYMISIGGSTDGKNKYDAREIARLKSGSPSRECNVREIGKLLKR